MSVLGAMMLDARACDAVLGEGLTAVEFHGPRNGRVFTAICTVHAEGGPADLVSVADELAKLAKEDGGREVASDVDLVEMVDACPSTSSAPKHARIILGHARSRRMMAAGLELAQAGRAGDVERGLAIAAEVATVIAPTLGPDSSGVVDWPTLWAADADSRAEWLVEPVIPAGRSTAIWSVAKSGKSLLALDLAAALATGRPTLDRPAAEPTSVLYCDWEQQPADLRDRLGALGYGPDTDLRHLAYLLLPNLPALDTAAGGAALMGLVRDHEPALVVFDTMARAVTGDENEADTFRDFYRYTGARLKAAGVAVVRLDHSGKDTTRGQRGSSAKNDDVDLVWRLTAEGRQVVTLHRTHCRVDWVPDVVRLARRDEPLHHATIDPTTWPDGTADLAAELDDHQVPLDATITTALETLKRHGPGRRKALVSAALRYRKARP